MCQCVTFFHSLTETDTLLKCLMEQLWASLDSHDLNLVQISHLTSLISAESERRWKTRTRLQDPVAKTETQRYSKFLCSLLMVTSSWVLLLFEEKLQCRVPLISGKAVGQLAVIQQMGNWAQTEKPSNPAVWPAQTRSNKTNWTRSQNIYLLGWDYDFKKRRTCVLGFVVRLSLIGSTVLKINKAR